MKQPPTTQTFLLKHIINPCSGEQWSLLATLIYSPFISRYVPLLIIIFVIFFFSNFVKHEFCLLIFSLRSRILWSALKDLNNHFYTFLFLKPCQTEFPDYHFYTFLLLKPYQTTSTWFGIFFALGRNFFSRHWKTLEQSFLHSSFSQTLPNYIDLAWYFSLRSHFSIGTKRPIINLPINKW